MTLISNGEDRLAAANSHGVRKPLPTQRVNNIKSEGKASMASEDCTVNIELTPDQILARSDSEKLALMIEVGFANHKAIGKLTKLLDGNGGPGLCERVRRQGWQIGGLWTLFTLIGGALIYAFWNHIAK